MNGTFAPASWRGRNISAASICGSHAVRGAVLARQRAATVSRTHHGVDAAPTGIRVEVSAFTAGARIADIASQVPSCATGTFIHHQARDAGAFPSAFRRNLVRTGSLGVKRGAATGKRRCHARHCHEPSSHFVLSSGAFLHPFRSWGANFRRMSDYLRCLEELGVLAATFILPAGLSVEARCRPRANVRINSILALRKGETGVFPQPTFCSGELMAKTKPPSAWYSTQPKRQ